MPYRRDMRIVHWLFHVDDLVAHEVAPRRARRLRAVAIAALIAAFPGVFIAYQQERLQSFVDRLTEHIAEVADRNLAGGR